MKKITAWEKICDKKREEDASWINIVSGNQIGTITEEDMFGTYVKLETIRKQARKDGFYTRMYGEELKIARNPFNYYC